MSQSFRHRMALSLAAAAFSAPLLAFGTAYAELPSSCSSGPSTDRLRVPAESTVTSVNGLGRRARLHLDGQAFDRPAKAAVSAVAGSRSSGRTSWAPGAPSSGTTSPARQATAPSNVDPPTTTTTAAAGSLGGAADETGPPDEADLGPGEASADATADGDTGLEGAALGPTGTTSNRAAEPLAAAGPAGDSRSKGLLALIATVCVFGLLAGVIRAIIAQRATRTRAA